jgi:hypothetical protein
MAGRQLGSYPETGFWEARQIGTGKSALLRSTSELPVIPHVEENGLAECQAPGKAGGKPCWITEWGVGGTNHTCPADDKDKVKLVREMRDYYAQLARQGRLRGLIFYVWHGDWHSDKENPASAFRCGALTESGRLAIAPM